MLVKRGYDPTISWERAFGDKEELEYNVTMNRKIQEMELAKSKSLEMKVPVIRVTPAMTGNAFVHECSLQKGDVEKVYWISKDTKLYLGFINFYL